MSKPATLSELREILKILPKEIIDIIEKKKNYYIKQEKIINKEMAIKFKELKKINIEIDNIKNKDKLKRRKKTRKEILKTLNTLRKYKVSINTFDEDIMKKYSKLQK
jgi:hypothetical protein